MEAIWLEYLPEQRSARTARVLRFGRLQILMSYETPIAYRGFGECYVCDNLTQTSSTHRSIAGFRGEKIPEEEFNKQLIAACRKEASGWPLMANDADFSRIGVKAFFALLKYTQQIANIDWPDMAACKQALSLLNAALLQLLAAARHETEPVVDIFQSLDQFLKPYSVTTK